jgi:hypothetical protein
MHHPEATAKNALKAKSGGVRLSFPERNRSMGLPPHTLTVSGSGGDQQLSGTITWLYERAGERSWALAAGIPIFVAGAGEGCTVRIESPYVSQFHCTLARTSRGRLCVQDPGSKNGTWFRDRRENAFEVDAGDSFAVGKTTLFAANDYMAAAREALRYYLGYAQPRATDDLVLWAATGEHLVIIGERASGHEAVARLAHAASPQRAQPFVVLTEIPNGAEALALVERCAGSTVFLMVRERPTRDPFVDALVDPIHKIRLYAGGTSAKQLKAMVSPESHARLRAVHLPPLRTRTSELRTLVDRAFTMHNLGFRAHDLGTDNLAALESHDWPDNMDELAELALRVGAVLSTGSERKAAASLGIHPSTLARWFDGRGLQFLHGDR